MSLHGPTRNSWTSVGLKDLGPQNLLRFCEKVRWEGHLNFWSLSILSHSDSFFLMSIPLLQSSLCHCDCLSTIALILPSPVSVLFLTSFPTAPPVPLPLLILLYSSCYHIMPAVQHAESPRVSRPQLKCQPLQHTSLPASTSSVPGSPQKTSRSEQFIKGPKVTEQFHYEAEGTELLRTDPQLNFFKCRRLFS